MAVAERGHQRADTKPHPQTPANRITRTITFLIQWKLGHAAWATQDKWAVVEKFDRMRPLEKEWQASFSILLPENPSEHERQKDRHLKDNFMLVVSICYCDQ